ncbi:MAG: YbdK family carboxylate-amine ligase, partial [Rhodospirillaceae bacterium]
MPTTLSGAPSPAIVQRDPAFTLGIEEEYLLVEPRTGAIAADPPPALMEALVAGSEQSPEGSVTPEFLRAQIEVGTRVCKTVPEASDCLKVLRGLVIAEAERHGLGLIAASTHPFAKWEALQHTDKERYSALAQDLQGPVRRLVICGMHVHVGIEDPDLRIDLMGQLSYFLPHLLALSTSSPFWKGLDSGMMSYRLSVFNELPRTGLPEAFSSYTEYQRHVDALVGAGVIEDSTKIWWDLRPSAHPRRVVMARGL